MPKDHPEIKLMQQQRRHKSQLQAERGYAALPPARVSLVVLGNGGPGNPRSLFMVSDQKSYLFNCGEGTQRLAHEHSVKLAKLDRIFLTRPIWDNIGGLPGLSMTLHAMGIPSIDVHTPSKIIHLYEATRLFSVSADMTINEVRACNQPHFSDNVMDSECIILKPSANDELSPKRIKTDDQSWIGQYVCRLTAKPGTLDIKKCQKLGVPRGPALGQLKNGQSVTLPDGRVINSSDVTAPDEPGSLFLVIDCPNENYLEQLVSCDQLRRFSTDIKSDLDMPAFVVHFSPDDIVSHPKYVEWCNRFPPSTSHLTINSRSPLTGFRSAQLQTKLNLIDGQIFPMITTHSEAEEDCSNIEASSSNGSSIFTATETKLKLNLRPTMPRLIKDEVHRFEPSEFITEAREIEGFEAELEQYHKSLNSLTGSEGISKYPELIFLGTGSAIPGKDRNVSCILVALNEDTNMLFDCGEGSYGQMVRFFGPKDVDDQLRKIKAIFISHHHADHHLGLINILLQRSELGTNDRIQIIAPESVRVWLDDYDATFERIAHTYTIAPSDQFLSNAPQHILDRLNLARLQTARVKHCKDSYGIAITTAGTTAANTSGHATSTSDQFKIAYSGDAQAEPPCQYFENIAQNSDVLIHEATMEDDLELDAAIKHHSTTAQAIAVADRVKAHHLILTHFSQRYAKIPVIDDSVLSRRPIGLAFDNMRVNRHTINRLPLLVKPLKILFGEYLEETLERQKKRNLKQQILEEVTSNS